MVDEKSNEITAIPKLLEILEIKGCLVTIDAMGCQVEIAQRIVDQEADYALSVKGNQPTLFVGVQEAAEDHLQKSSSFEGKFYHRTVEKGHGRHETRDYFVVDVPKDLPDRSRWPKLNAIGLACNTTIRDGQESIELRYYILSRKMSAKEFGEGIRGHWSIENRLHWQLDVTFDEDRCRIRKDHASANFSILRRTALSLLKNENTVKIGMKNKRNVAAINESYLEQVLFGNRL